MESIKKTAIYGGTFSPPHIGHIKAALALYESIKPAALYIMPASIPPHKLIESGDDPKARLEMLKLAFGDCPYWENGIYVSDYEISMAGISYTVKTLEYFKEHTKDDLVFLCGGDMFETLETWFNAKRIFELAEIAYVKRGDIRLEDKAAFYRKKFGARLIEIEMEAVGISSTELRNMLASGADVSGYIPPKVVEYIKSRHLYGA